MRWRQFLVSHLAVVAAALLLSGCAQSGHSTARQAGTPASARPIDATGRSLADLFRGRAGVTVYQVDGGVRLRLRGGGDLDGRGDPLFVVDGVPTEPPGGVFSMNPNDIATIEIIKDDASAAVYGLRGINGIVKITTKRR